ncbi:GapA-binding peptide SR1P [Cytobacillus sp. Hz8]
MGTIVCQDCESTIAYFEDEKVTVLYSKCDCPCCKEKHHHEK